MTEEDNKKTLNLDELSFDDVVNTFIDHIESLSTSLPYVLGTVNSTNQKAVKLHQDFLNKDCEKKVDEKGNEYYTIKPEHARRNRLLTKEIKQSSIASTIIQRNYIVSLVSQFDSFIGSLIRRMFYIRPELLNDSDKQLSFSNLMQFQDLSTAREYIIEKEIESVLRENHTSHFKWIENKIDTPLRKDLPIWPIFIELTERRNLYVHNNGIVSNQYIKTCQENGVTLDASLKIGDTLVVNETYFKNAFKCVFELGLKLSQVMWRKLLPKHIAKADNSLLNISFDLIQNEEYELAQEILNFSDKYIKKFSSDDMKFRLILNRAQTFKWLGNKKECDEIINSRDWTACSDIFKLASQVLLDDYVNAVETMKRLGKDNKQIDKTRYKEWPIFKEFRKTDTFIKCYEEIFGENIEVKEKYSPSGFKIIELVDFKQKLDDCLALSLEKPNGFLSLKFFIETYLAEKNYDKSSCWEIYHQLEEAKEVETYKHIDPIGKFPPISAIKKIK